MSELDQVRQRFWDSYGGVADRRYWREVHAARDMAHVLGLVRDLETEVARLKHKARPPCSYCTP